MFFLKRIVFIIFTISAYPVSANVVITGTRVIYPAGQHNVNVQLTNVGISPSLIQAWIDNGDPKAAPETIKTPFVITPPIARIDGNKGQTLRLSYTGEPLPADRESVFYLNVL
ncbi:TPA: fimbria/pilus periplasmic chaperone, partial [Escherichia coli]